MINKRPTTTKRPRGAGRIFKRGDILWVQYYSATGKQIRESSHSEDTNVAEKLLRQRVGAVAAGVGPDSASPSYRKIRDGYLRRRLSQNDKSLPRRVNGTLILGGDGLPQIDAVSRCDLVLRERSHQQNRLRHAGRIRHRTA
jgi:hypothetical protein